MRQPWQEFLDGDVPSGHAVQVYEDEASLADVMAEYLARGLDRGEPAVVVATHGHWSACAAALARRGWDAARLERSDLLFLTDARATLAALIVDGAPDRNRFADVVGGLVSAAEERFPGRPIRAFGDMVDVLCARGNRRAAVALEALWNDLLRLHSCSLLCAYGLDVFDRAAQAMVLPDICVAHTHVRPSADPDRLEQAVAAALDDALRADTGKVYALADAEHGESPVSSSQRALMWLSANMPAHADRVLVAARDRYRAA
jgi:DcmR-like sensory protein